VIFPKKLTREEMVDRAREWKCAGLVLLTVCPSHKVRSQVGVNREVMAWGQYFTWFLGAVDNVSVSETPDWSSPYLAVYRKDEDGLWRNTGKGQRAFPQ
jgi:hypothetical protein